MLFRSASNYTTALNLVLLLSRLFVNLTPFIPLSFGGEGEEIVERGFAPLLPTPPHPLIREGGQGDRLLNNLLLSCHPILLQ